MRYVLFNWLSPADVAIWESWSADQQAADVERHREWFARHREHIVSGEELDEPRTAKTLRPGRQAEGVVVTDGPFLEAKEILGGFVVIEAAGRGDRHRVRVALSRHDAERSRPTPPGARPRLSAAPSVWRGSTTARRGGHGGTRAALEGAWNPSSPSSSWSSASCSSAAGRRIPTRSASPSTGSAEHRSPGCGAAVAPLESG